MGYVAVKGGMAAIQAAEELVQEQHTSPDAPTLTVRQILAQQRALVDQAMGEGSLYAPELAALAVKQAEGDTMEAAFLLRAFRSTLPRIGDTLPADGGEMRIRRRVSSTFKDIPGGQVLGRTRDYTQRLLDFSLMDGNPNPPAPFPTGEGGARRATAASLPVPPTFPKVSTWLRADGLLPPLPEHEVDSEPFDVTRHSLVYPFPRSARLQTMARGETGGMIAFAYSSLRGRGFHPIPGDLRVGELPFRIVHPLTGTPVRVGEVTATEVEMINKTGEQEHGKAGGMDGTFSLAYGLVFGQNERKAIAMSILDGLLMERSDRLPVHDPEFVLYHIDGIEAQGFVEHLKLPHYVTFQSSLDKMRYFQNLHNARQEEAHGRAR
ncbi:MAG: carbon-phosphorus lyase complex subunit PhnI [Chloroflexota bacterium]|nr:carbon-phosphorus lyase complex subunit PhnI [Chloroflexota bacterium]